MIPYYQIFMHTTELPDSRTSPIFDTLSFSFLNVSLSMTQTQGNGAIFFKIIMWQALFSSEGFLSENKSLPLQKIS